MPQASLLSYFAKPLTAVPAVPKCNAGPRKEESGHGGDGMVPTSRSILQGDGLGIMGELHQLSPKETTTDAQQTEATDAILNVHDANGRVFEAPPNYFSNRPSESLQVILIPLLPGAMITTVQKTHLPSIQRLTSTTLPVRYGEAFFTSAVSDPTSSQLSRVALYSSDPVGWIRCRLESSSPDGSASLSKLGLSQIYIQALALLSPYRGLGIATMLLDAVLGSSIAKADTTVCIYAHVWEKNEDALEWYAKRGFKRVMLIERYYKRLRPGGAWIVRKELDGG